jgi:hypothetical protein
VTYTWYIYIYKQTLPSLSNLKCIYVSFKLILECPQRTFGQNCEKECHCLNSTSCNNINGACLVGFCDAGWHGSSCSQDDSIRPGKT